MREAVVLSHPALYEAPAKRVVPRPGHRVNVLAYLDTGTNRGGLPPRWGFHGLRHYYATLLIHGGASVKTVQLALGHSTSTITLNEYVHEWPDAVDRTRSLVDNALGTYEAAATSARSRS